jgi:hypothetical protein
MTYLHCDDCGFVAAGGPHSLASVCPHCKINGRVVRLTQVRRAFSPTGVISDGGKPVGDRERGGSPQATRARLRRSRPVSG